MNEILITIYNTVITTATESIDWLTICLTIIGLFIAYYGLLYNRPRIEIEPYFGNYELNENLKYIKFLFHNIGTISAFNIEIKNINSDNKYFGNPKETDKCENMLKIMDKIKSREASINGFFESKINILLPNKKKINHFTDYSPEIEVEDFVMTSLDVEITYNDIRKLDIIGFTFFYILNLSMIPKLLTKKIKKCNPISVNLKKKEFIIRRKEIKTISFKEKLNEDPVEIQKKLLSKKFENYIPDEFENFLNSFKFKNWFTTLNKLEKEKMAKILIKSNYNPIECVTEFKRIKKLNISKKHIKESQKSFLDKYIQFIKMIDSSPCVPSDYKENVISKIISSHEDEQKKYYENNDLQK